MAATYLRAVVACAVTALLLCLYVYSYLTQESSTTATNRIIDRSHKTDQELQYTKQPEADDHDVSSTAVPTRSSAEHAPSLAHHLSTSPITISIAHDPSTPPNSASIPTGTASVVHRPSITTGTASVVHRPSITTGTASVVHRPSITTGTASLVHRPSIPTGTAFVVHHPTITTGTPSVVHRPSITTGTPLNSASIAHHPSTPSTAFVAHQSSSPQTTSQVDRDLSFTVARDFTFPHPQVFKPVNVVLACRWVKELKQHLSSVDPAQPVTVTVASYDFAANLLNWLISAQVMTSPPLENILVISFDSALHKMLIRRQISSVCVPYISVLRNAKSLGIHKVWMTRLAVIRLINHWGFDVQQFDTDAIIRRNPQPLFNSFPGFDVVGSRAKLPFELGKGQWGFTVCMGVILFRSTPRTGESWRSLFYYNTLYYSSISI